MTGPMTPFDHRPDTRLGEALRAALDAGDQAAFVARVVAAAERPARTVDVLAAWARRGLVATMAAAAVAGFLVGRGSAPTSSPEDALAPASAGAASVALVTATQPPDASVVFASLVTGSR